MTRLGAVDYLNARPLVEGLGRRGQGRAPTAEDDLLLRFDVPSVCARLLAEGAIDLGLIPTIAYADIAAGLVVPGIAIASTGPVDSVAIFTKKKIRDVRSLALDTSSRTSVALTKILCAKVFGIEPSFVPHAPDLAAMLAACDAALIIGDPALFAGPAPAGVEKIDLGEVWTSWTSRPFVWAFWTGRAGAVDAAVVLRLQQARDAGVAASDRIADAYCAGDPLRQALARRYLREHIKYRLTSEELAGLQRYYQEAAAIGILNRVPDIAFY